VSKSSFLAKFDQLRRMTTELEHFSPVLTQKQIPGLDEEDAQSAEQRQRQEQQLQAFDQMLSRLKSKSSMHGDSDSGAGGAGRRRRNQGRTVGEAFSSDHSSGDRTMSHTPDTQRSSEPSDVDEALVDRSAFEAAAALAREQLQKLKQERVTGRYGLRQWRRFVRQRHLERDYVRHWHTVIGAIV
jgi:hypothetical protein